MDEIDRKADGHRLGNFHNYYSFHDTNSRLALLPVNFFLTLWHSLGEPPKFLILDVGCNEGDLTIELHRRALAEVPSSVQCITLGVDIDPALIERANNKFSSDFISFLTAKFLDDDQGVPVIRCFLETHCLDKGHQSFSFVSLFSITMWVHLNHGDDGVVNFIKAATDLTSGSILIEPQPWKCYRSAARRCRKLGLAPHAHYQDLTIRDIDAEACKLMRLPEYDMKSFWPLGTEIWGRSLLVFHRGVSEHLETFPLRKLDLSVTVALGNNTNTSTSTTLTPAQQSNVVVKDDTADTTATAIVTAGTTASKSTTLEVIVSGSHCEAAAVVEEDGEDASSASPLSSQRAHRKRPHTTGGTEADVNDATSC